MWTIKACGTIWECSSKHKNNTNFSIRWLKWQKQLTCRKFCVFKDFLISKKLLNKIFQDFVHDESKNLWKWYLHLHRCYLIFCKCGSMMKLLLHAFLLLSLHLFIYKDSSILVGSCTKKSIATSFMCEMTHSNSCLYVNYMSSSLNFQITHLFKRSFVRLLVHLFIRS